MLADQLHVKAWMNQPETINVNVKPMSILISAINNVFCILPLRLISERKAYSNLISRDRDKDA